MFTVAAASAVAPETGYGWFDSRPWNALLLMRDAISFGSVVSTVRTTLFEEKLLGSATVAPNSLVMTMFASFTGRTLTETSPDPFESTMRLLATSGDALLNVMSPLPLPTFSFAGFASLPPGTVTRRSLQ